MKARQSPLLLILLLSLWGGQARAEDDGPVVLSPAPVGSAASAGANGTSSPGPVDAPMSPRVTPSSDVPPGATSSSLGTASLAPAGDAPAPTAEPTLATPRTVYKRRYNMALFGGALLLASFTADRLLMGDLSKSPVAWIPLAGPWFLIDLQLRQPIPNSATVLFLAIDGVLQATGLTMTVLGLVLRERRMTVRLVAPSPALPAATSTTGLGP